MADTAPPPDRVPDPPQTTRDGLQRRESEAANQAERRAPPEPPDRRLHLRLLHLTAFAEGLLAPGEHPRGTPSSPTWPAACWTSTRPCGRPIRSILDIS